MPTNNPLTPVFETYEMSRDCVKITRRSIGNDNGSLLSRTEFHEMSIEAAGKSLEKCRAQLDDLAVLALWSAFERFVIEHVQNRYLLASNADEKSFSKRLAEKFNFEVERWRFTDILDLFKDEVSADVLGHAKQIKKYRDWVAHRNPQIKTPTQTEPETAYAVLTNVIGQLLFASEKHDAEPAN